MPLLDDNEWRLVGNPLGLQRAPSGLFRRAVGDTAVDLAKGVVGFGQSAVGLADLATAGLAGDALNYMGYDPQRTQQFFGQYYSPERQEAEQAVQSAEGFVDTTGALLQNPSTIFGRGVQSAPMLLGSMGVANRVYQGTQSLPRAVAAGHVTEGAMTAGSVAQGIREEGGSRGDMYWAVPAGVATGAIGYGAGRFLPEGQIESLLIPGARSATASGAPAGLLRRTAASALSEGVLEEMPQSAQEQMFTNLGLGRDPMYRVPEAAGEGLVVGGATGGVLGPFRRGAPQPSQLLPGANAPGTATPPAPPQPPLRLGFSGYDTGVGPLITFPDGSTMTKAEYDRYVVNMPQGPEPLGAYQPDRQFQYEGAIPFTPVNLLAPQGPVQPSLQIPLVRGQGDLFDPLMEGAQPNAPVAPQEPGAAPSTEMGALFEAYPEALVRTEYGMPQIRAALRNANGGILNAQLQRFIPEFSRAIEQGIDAVDALITRYDNAKSTLRPEVFETAAQMAQDFQTRMVNAQAAAGLRRARPGVTVGAAPSAEASAGAMYDAQERIREGDAGDRQRQQLAGAIADTDARVQGAREQQSAAGRRQVLDTALEGAQNAGNARNRFIKALRKAGYRDTIVRPDEQQVIDRFFGAREAFVDQDPDVLPSAPNEMGEAVPEKQAGEQPKQGRPKRENENRSFRLTPPPSTEEDLAALDKARAKRERKAGTQEPPPVAEGTTTPKQGVLFTKKGQPSAQATKEATDAVQKPSPAPVPPRERARAGQPVGEGVPGQGQAAAEGQAKPEKPKARRSKVKAKIGEQEVELEVDNADEKIAAMKKDIDKYEAFVACLRKK